MEKSAPSKPGNQTNLASSCFICSADKVWPPSHTNRSLAGTRWTDWFSQPSSNSSLDKYDDGAEKRCRGNFNNNKDGCCWCRMVCWWSFRGSIPQPGGRFSLKEKTTPLKAFVEERCFSSLRHPFRCCDGLRVGMSRYHFFTTNTAAWASCRYRYQSDTLFYSRAIQNNKKIYMEAQLMIANKSKNIQTSH